MDPIEESQIGFTSDGNKPLTITCGNCKRLIDNTERPCKYCFPDLIISDGVPKDNLGNPYPGYEPNNRRGV